MTMANPRTPNPDMLPAVRAVVPHAVGERDDGVAVLAVRAARAGVAGLGVVPGGWWGW